MRVSCVAPAACPGSTCGSRLPLPLVSSTNGDQPCARTSSPVSSNSLRLIQPTAPGPCTPLENQSVLFASSAKIRWCVGKQVLISVNLPVAGSYIEACREALFSGNTFADG